MSRIEVPPSALSRDALRALVEEFVTRDGTDYGAVERSLEAKVADVMRQIDRGEVRIAFDPETETTTLVPADRRGAPTRAHAQARSQR